MFKTILFLLALIPSIASAVSPNDIRNAVNVVAPKMHVPVYVEVLQNLEDPMGASWTPFTRTCTIYVSAKNINYLGLLMFSRPAEEMLEGLVAHEIAHCIDQREVSDKLGVTAARQLFTNPGIILQSEVLGDIMAIMYWKQEYPKDAEYLAEGLLDWRRLAAQDDALHATFPAVSRALPQIPNHISYKDALSIRASVNNTPSQR